MNIEVQVRDDNIEAIISNEYKLLVVSMDGLSLLTSLVDFESPTNFLKIDNQRTKKFIRKCLMKLANELHKVNKD